MSEVPFEIEILGDYLARGHTVCYVTADDEESIRSDLLAIGTAAEDIDRGLVLGPPPASSPDPMLCELSRNRKVYIMASSIQEALKTKTRQSC